MPKLWPAWPGTTSWWAPRQIADALDRAAPRQPQRSEHRQDRSADQLPAARAISFATPANSRVKASPTTPCASTAASTATIRPTATSPSPTIRPSMPPPAASSKPSPACAALAEHNPGDPRYSVALGTMLTYDAATRAEGIRILQAHPNDPDAQAACVRR